MMIIFLTQEHVKARPPPRFPYPEYVRFQNRIMIKTQAGARCDARLVHYSKYTSKPRGQ